ncbi:MAG TPA: class I SAM-dependent methyltransferase [Candidatus Acidoferrales bacterium]|nr:class I SAM-dependent methyltransferase [Candidatus Acidoferrales bacterium]
MCPICDKQDWEHTQKVRNVSISKCVHCGLLETTDFLKGISTFQGIYDTPPEHHSEYREYYLSNRLALYRRVMPKLDRFRMKGFLLEVGCSYGYFLETARSAGWEAEGVEISNNACIVARSKGFKVFQEGLREVPLNPGSCDVIAMWDVIEHLTDVAEIVECCAALLRPGGALIARTPDARALQHAKGLFRAAYRHLAYPANTAEHVFHFTPETLSLLMAKKGLREVEIDAGGGWEERVISGRNPLVRLGRDLVLRYAYVKGWPYEFVITAVKR